MILFVALLLIPWLLPAYGLQVAIEAAILAIFALSFNFLFHQTGLLSFGHAAFYGASAYATALLMSKLGWPYLATLPFSLCVSALLALVVGFFSVRLTRIYFTMLTLAFAQILWAIVHKWYAFTGGDNGITGLRFTGVLANATFLYYLGLVLLAVAAGVIFVVARSPAGYTLRAVRDNPARAEAIGISPFEYAVGAFVLSGALTGLAGFLQAAWQRSAFPDLLYWTTSAEVIIATILGGSRYFLGPVVGAIVLVVVEAIVRSHTEYWPLALGIVLLALVLFFPAGVIGLFGAHERKQRRGDAAA
ncbi:MAG TPA: branched-chain amino acid ABC transporter permease [Candidatus Acidoferrales bacterium]|nr:branched-chain amino acid ABC transporter permease [Candidatus Acidoferrales bacterium]